MERIWLFRHDELLAVAQQHSRGRAHLYMYVDAVVTPRRTDLRMRATEFDEFLLERRWVALFVG